MVKKRNLHPGKLLEKWDWIRSNARLSSCRGNSGIFSPRKPAGVWAHSDLQLETRQVQFPVQKRNQIVPGYGQDIERMSQELLVGHQDEIRYSAAEQDFSDGFDRLPDGR